MAMGQKKTLGDHRFWSIFPFANRVFRYPVFLTHSHINPTEEVLMSQATLLVERAAPQIHRGNDRLHRPGNLRCDLLGQIQMENFRECCFGTKCGPTVGM